MNKKKTFIISLVLLIVCIVIIALIINGVKVYRLDKQINNIEEGYKYTKEIIDSFCDDAFLISYEIGYMVSDIDYNQPLFYEYRFNIAKQDGYNETDGYIANIDLKDKILKIVRHYPIDVAIETTITDTLPSLNEITNILYSQYYKKFVKSVLEHGKDSIIIVSKNYQYKDIPFFNYWSISVTHKNHILGNIYEAYSLFTYDADTNTIVEAY